VVAATVLGLLGLVAVVTPVVGTVVGARRRGASRSRAALGGLFFPVTWCVWYVADAHRGLIR
jgi:nucleoside permease NupC